MKLQHGILSLKHKAIHNGSFENIFYKYIVNKEYWL